MPGSSGRPISIGRAERCPWRRFRRGDFGGAALSLICGGEWGSGSVADPWSVALPFLQVFKTGGGAAPAARGGGEARAAGTGEAASPPLRPRFCTFIKAWECRAGAPQRGGLPGIKWRVSTTGAEGAPDELRPRFCTFIKAWGCRAGAPQRGGLPAGSARPERRARPRILRRNGRMQDMAGGLVQSAKNVNKR